MEVSKGEKIQDFLQSHKNSLKLKDLVVLRTLNHFKHYLQIHNISYQESVEETFLLNLDQMLKTHRGSFGNDPKLAEELQKLKLHFSNVEIRGDSRLLFSCNHLTPVYRRDVEIFQQSKKYSVVYCSRCEAKSVATKVIRTLERREQRLAMAAGSEDSALLDFVDSGSMYKSHPPENLKLYEEQEIEQRTSLKKKFKKEEKKLKAIAEEWPISDQINYKSNSRTFELLREQRSTQKSKIRLLKLFDKFAQEELYVNKNMERVLEYSEAELRMKQQRLEEERVDKAKQMAVSPKNGGSSKKRLLQRNQEFLKERARGKTAFG